LRSGSSVVTGAGVPPAAEMRNSGPDASGAKTITLAGLHAAPRPPGASQSVSPRPPAAEIVFSFVVVKKPIL
jgi:hypothetical protein